MATANQNPEQIARDQIDDRLVVAGWVVQKREALDFSAAFGIAVREYPTDTGPADYVLFVDRKAVGVIEAKPKDWGHKITTVEDQSTGYAEAKLKWVNNKEPLPFVYESTGVITRFTYRRDPHPRSREVFTFARPQTMAEWLSSLASAFLRQRSRLWTLSRRRFWPSAGLFPAVCGQALSRSW
jgi:type I restriction enzyme R subunit